MPADRSASPSSPEVTFPEIRSSIRIERDDPEGDRMILNMGPQHPSTHGVLRLVLELDGEIIRQCDPVIGYLHRGKEKEGEFQTLHQFTPYTDRLDYLAPLANNVAYILAVEKLLGIEAPLRAQVIRVICAELSRISAHLLGLGCYGMDLGAMTVFLWTFRERETVYSLIEKIAGARFTTSYTRIGGVSKEPAPGFWEDLAAFVRTFPSRVDEYEKLLTRNRIWLLRTQGIGVIPREMALRYGLTGPNLRGSGVPYDLRKDRPYLTYDRYDFDVPIGSTGDCFDRYLCRIEELRQSTRILDQAMRDLPDGPIVAADAKRVFPAKGKVLTRMEELIEQFIVATEDIDAPKGQVYFGHENPKGEFGIYLRSEGGPRAARLRLRGPSFLTLGVLPELLPGHLVADVMAVLSSLDFVMGECDR